jgi:hypothetical protein
LILQQFELHQRPSAVEAYQEANRFFRNTVSSRVTLRPGITDNITHDSASINTGRDVTRSELSSDNTAFNILFECRMISHPNENTTHIFDILFLFTTRTKHRQR